MSPYRPDVKDPRSDLGLGTLGGDVGDAELFFLRPVMVIANKDAAAVPIQAGGHAEAAQQAVAQGDNRRASSVGKGTLRAGRDLPASGGAAVEQREAYDLAKFFAEVGVVEPGSPFAQDEIRTTRCNSFGLNANVSCLNRATLSRGRYGAAELWS